MDFAVQSHVEAVLEGPVEVAGRVVHENHCDLQLVGTAAGMGFAVKVIEPEALAQSEDPEAIAEWLAAVGGLYIERLRGFGVSLPPFSHTATIKNGRRRPAVVQILSATGPDFRVLLRAQPTVLDEILTILRSWLDLWGRATPSIGIDPDPSNFGFCLKGDRRAVYFDFYPARFLTGDGVWLVGFPQPQETTDVQFSVRRYYDPEGILRRLHFNVGMVVPHPTERIVAAATRVYSWELAGRIASFYANLPVARVANWLEAGRLDEVRTEIEGCGLAAVDDLRAIAQLLLSPGGELRWAFALSHVDFRLSSQQREGRLEELKELLVSKLGE